MAFSRNHTAPLAVAFPSFLHHGTLVPDSVGARVFLGFAFRVGLHRYNSSPVTDPAASLHTSDCKAEPQTQQLYRV